MLRALMVLIAAATFCGGVRAHTVPVIVVESEFGAQREVTIKVNLDPRLFLHAQPTSVPAIPASWWFEQDDAAREKTKRDAIAYVERTLDFTVGATPLKGEWTVQPIDSASAFPLGQASAEAHMLVEHRGVLPEVAGDFKVAIAKECAVAVILLCSKTGDPERRPQSLFPGETSRAFALPALPAKPAPPPAAASAPASTAIASFITLPGTGHFIGDHLLLAILLGVAFHRRLWSAVLPLISFHVGDLLGAHLVISGWFPPAPLWMQIAYWVALAVTVLHLFVLKSNAASIYSAISVAGWCHGMDLPNVHLPAEAPSFLALLHQTGVLFALELALLLATASLMRIARRNADRRISF